MIKKCNVCNNDIEDDQVYYSLLKDYVGLNTDYMQEICLCDNCGFIFVRNPLTQEQLDEQYKNFSKYEFENDSIDVKEIYKKRCIEQKSFIENSLRDDSIENMLEIGAASGFNLSLYSNIDVLGIEPSKWNCENAKNIFDVDMYPGTFDEYIKEFPENKFDLIFLSHTLEHIVNPFDFVRECSKINNEYFFIEVPSFDYKFKDEPFGMFTDEHVNMFTFESLQNLMNVAGYTFMDAEISFFIEDIEPSGYPAIRTLWKKSDEIIARKPVYSTKLLFETYLSWSKRAIELINAKIDAIPEDSNIALWGIGNTASRILGSTNLGEKHIVRVYDSDQRKHGLIFAGSEITSFNPKDIEQGIIDTVVITTCKVQNVLLDILEPYKDKVNIVLLFDV